MPSGSAVATRCDNLAFPLFSVEIEETPDKLLAFTDVETLGPVTSVDSFGYQHFTLSSQCEFGGGGARHCFCVCC